MELTARAEAVTRDDDVRGVLALAIALWRATPRLELAGLVDDITRALGDAPGGAPPVPQLVDGATARDPLVQGGLLAALCETPLHELPARLEALRAWRDPRVAPAAVRVLRKTIFLENARREGGAAIAAIVDESGDARVRRALEAARREQPSFLAADEWSALVDGLAARVEARMAGEPPLDEDGAAALAILRAWWERAEGRRRWALRMTPAERRFWDGLAQAPDDGALRQVLADGLIEAGDPRGELLVRAARGDALDAATLRAAWLRDAPATIVADEVLFEGGLPTAARVRSWDPADAAHPLWRVLGELSIGAGGVDPWSAEGAGVPSFPSLRRVRGLGAQGFARLLALTPPAPIRELEVVWGAPLPERTGPATGAGLPSLERLKVTMYALDDGALAALDELLDGPIAARLRAFSLVGPPADPGAWQRLFARRRASLDELSLEQRFSPGGSWGTRVRLRRRSDDGDGLRLTVWIARAASSDRPSGGCARRACASRATAPRARRGARPPSRWR